MRNEMDVKNMAGYQICAHDSVVLRTFDNDLDAGVANSILVGPGALPLNHAMTSREA